MKLDVGKVVDHMTRGNCTPWLCEELTLWRVDMMIILFLFIILRLGHILIRIKPIRYIWLVRVMKCRVGNIRVKRDRGEVWITYVLE